MSDYTEGIKEVMRDMMSAAKSECAWMYENLPREATNDAQRALQQKHKSPYEFGRSVVNALDMISPSEAREAIERYAREWRDAGKVTAATCPKCGGSNVEVAPEHEEGERIFCFDCNGGGR